MSAQSSSGRSSRGCIVQCRDEVNGSGRQNGVRAAQLRDRHLTFSHRSNMLYAILILIGSLICLVSRLSLSIFHFTPPMDLVSPLGVYLHDLESSQNKKPFMALSQFPELYILINNKHIVINANL